MTTYPVDTGYYPSCVVHFTLRFDEALQVAENEGDLQKAILSGEYGLRPEALREVTGRVGDIVGDHYDQSGGFTRNTSTGRRTVTQTFGPQVRMGDVTAQRYDADGNLVTSAVVTEHEVGDEGGRSLSPLTFTGDKFTTLMNLVPTTGNFDLPHPRQAATWSLTFPYDTLPIDPRLLRAVGVEIHLGCVDARDYGNAMVGAHGRDGQASSILPTRSGLVDPFTGKPASRDSTLLFYGTCDMWEAEHAPGGSTATLTGRSIVGILLDGKPPVNVMDELDLERPIHRVIADLIATIPTDNRLAIDVVTDASEWEGGVVPSPGNITGYNTARIGTKTGKVKQGSGAATDRISYWDLITNLCNSVGGIPHLQGAQLWVRPGRSIFEIQARPGIGPFQSDRIAPDGKLAVRRLVLGRNVEKLKLSRKFGGVVVPVVIAYGFDDQAQGAARLISGQWPPADSPEAGAKKEGDEHRITIAGIRDRDRLIQIARDVYEEIGRGETGCEFSTATLASFGGDNADPDMLRLRPLEPIEATVDAARGPTPIVHQLTMQANSTFQQEVDALRSRIGDVDAARAIVAARRGAVVGILDAFRVISVNFSLSDKGVAISGTCQNYIVSRHGSSAAAARANKGKPDIKTARATVPGGNRQKKVHQPTTSAWQEFAEESQKRAAKTLADPDAQSERQIREAARAADRFERADRNSRFQ
jgi:hypothetical protein